MQRGQMSKRFKRRIARVLPSFHTCRSQDVVPIPSVTAPSSSSPSSLIKRHVSSALVSVGCRFRSSSSSSSIKSNRPTAAAAAAASAPDPSPASDFQWQKDEKWHVIAKVPTHHRRRKISSHRSNSSSDDDEYFSKRSADGGKTRARKKPTKKKILRRKKSFVRRASLRFSSSSFDNYCWFSSSERECGFIHDEFLETRTLVSSNSRSFSSSTHSDGGEEEANPGTRRRRKELRLKCPSPEIDSPARVSVFQRMVGCGGGGEGKVKESFAVVKRSEDPYGDFRRSMLEMIVEKEMYEKEDLEQLLHCFLSLNSQAHHGVIVQAFSEIWEILFSGRRQA
ncbi:hypothetical protein ACLOJK_002843 [Asimina triloba]